MKIDRYEVCPNINEKILREEGFKHGTYRCYIYKQSVQLAVYIDIEDNWWSYQIYNADSDSLYAPYYNRAYGLNDVVVKIDDEVKKILNEMVKKNILRKIKK